VKNMIYVAYLVREFGYTYELSSLPVCTAITPFYFFVSFYLIFFLRFGFRLNKNDEVGLFDIGTMLLQCKFQNL
jgi:hypothetical protein